MPLFKYEASTRTGERVRGTIEAGDRRDAVDTLRQRSLFPLRLESASRQGRSGLTPAAVRRRGPLSGLKPTLASNRVFYFRQLGVMLRSGLSIVQALEIASHQATTAGLERATLRMIERIRQGSTLSAAMSLEPLFSPYVIRMIESAEASGELDRVCDEIAEHIEHSSNLVISLVTSLAYPAIVFVVAVGVASFLVLKVLPTVSRVLSRRGLALRWPAQTLIRISDFFQTYDVLLLVISFVVGAAIFVWLSTATGRHQASVILLRVPLIGPLFQAAVVSRFCRTLSMLLESGVSVLDGLKITATVIRNRAVRVKVLAAADGVLNGQGLASSMETRLLPPILTSVIAVGEATGAMSTVLRELSEFYDKDLGRRIRRLAVLAEPAILLFVGLMVFFVYYALIDAILNAQVGGRG